MNFSAPITYNGWTATLTRQAGGLPSSGYLVESMAASRVGSEGYLDKRALQDGMDAFDVYLAGRDIGMIVTVFGSTQGDFWDKAQDLLAAFSPTLAYDASTSAVGFLPLDFYQPTADVSTWPTSTYPYGIPLRYYVRPSAPPSFDVGRDEAGSDTGRGLSHRFSLSLIAKDPRKYLQSSVTVALTGASSPSLTYRGDYPTLPIFANTLTSTGSSAFTIIVDTKSVVIDLSGQTTGTFSLDFATRTLTDADGTSYASLITSADAFSAIKSGTVVGRTNILGSGGVTITYREAWA